MSTKLLILTVIGSISVGAAAAGGYAALRKNRMEAPPVVATAPQAAQAYSESPALPEPQAPALPEPQAQAVPPVVSSPSRPAPEAAPARKTAKPRPAPSVRPIAPASAPASSAAPVNPPVIEAPATDTASAKNDVAPAVAPDPARPRFDDLTVARDTVIGIKLDSSVSSDTARVEEKITGRVTRDVTVDGHTAISSGARVEGVVASVDRGGKFRDRPRLGVRFHSLVLADGTRVPIQTETIFREGDSPTGSAATKVGAGAAVGGILGAVLGGKKGAAIGATVGAAGGTGAVMAGSPSTVMLSAGTPLTVRLTAPLTVTIQRQE
jgi:hypothetical protein